MWRAIFVDKHKAADEVFRHKDVERAAALLRDPASSDLFWGFDDLARTYIAGLAQPGLMEKHRLFCSRMLVWLAEMLGVVRLFNPEAGPQSKPSISPDAVLDALDDLFGKRVQLPNIYRAEFGLLTSRGVLSYRTIHALFLLARLQTLLGELKGRRILEIGAGLGRTAYFGSMLGADAYDVVDIAFTAAVQGYFLGRTLGAGAVCLQGETGERYRGARVHLLTPDDFLNVQEKYDIIVNVDSLTEIPAPLAQHYVDKIVGSSEVFLSINHEVNAVLVRDLFKKTRGVISCRYPYWLRRGYAEEVYRWGRSNPITHVTAS